MPVSSRARQLGTTENKGTRTFPQLCPQQGPGTTQLCTSTKTLAWLCFWPPLRSWSHSGLCYKQKLFQKKETEFKVVLSDTWLNLHISVIPLFTVLPPWPLGLLEPAHPSLPSWMPPPRAVDAVETFLCLLPGESASAWPCCCTTKAFSDIQRHNTAFFLPPCGFCATINLISSDLARACFPCNLATTGRCEALASTCQELDFPSVVQVLTTGCNTTTNTKDSAVKGVFLNHGNNKLK